MKNIFKVLAGLLGLVGIVAIVWTALYFTVPKVKDWTNTNILKQEQKEEAGNEEDAGKIEELEEQLAQALKDKEEAQTQLVSKTEELETALAGKTEVETQLAGVNSQLAEKQALIEELQQDAIVDEATIAELQADVTELTSAKQELETTLAQKNATIAELENQIELLEEILNESGETLLTEILEQDTSPNIFSDGSNMYLSTRYVASDYYRYLKGTYVFVNGKSLKKISTIDDVGACIKIDDGSVVFYSGNQVGEFFILNEGNVVETNKNSSKYKLCIEISEDDLLFIPGDHYVNPALIMNLSTYEFTEIEMPINTRFDNYLQVSDDEYLISCTTNGTNNATLLFNTTNHALTKISDYNSNHLPLSIKLKDGNYLLYLNSSTVKYNVESKLFETVAKDFDSNWFFTNQVGYYECDNGDLYMVAESYPGLKYYNLQENKLYEVEENLRVCTIKSTSEAIFIANNSLRDPGLYILNLADNYLNTTVTKIYNEGLYWDTFVENENGVTITSSINPEQGTLYYDYSTGTCTKVTETLAA